jgi:hypothetical protein
MKKKSIAKVIDWSACGLLSAGGLALIVLFVEGPEKEPWFERREL